MEFIVCNNLTWQLQHKTTHKVNNERKVFWGSQTHQQVKEGEKKTIVQEARFNIHYNIFVFFSFFIYAGWFAIKSRCMAAI